MTSPTLEEQITCAERELKMRRRVYGRKVADGAMNPEVAEREIQAMTAIIASLQKLQRLTGETLL